MRKHPSRIFAAVTAAGLMASLSACQVKPGEYRIYKIAALDPQMQADCGVNVDPRDSSTFFGASTIQIFASDADDYFLEYGDTVLIGSRSGTEYTFQGDEVQVDEPIDDTTVTVERSLDVVISIKGHKITGDVVDFTSTKCGGNCDGVPTTQCTIIGSFFGSEIKDVELERGV